MADAAFAATLLEASATAYGAFAADRLLEQSPGAGERFGPRAMMLWKGELTRRIEELAAALRAGEPQMFVARVDAARQTFLTHEIPESDVRESLVSLQHVLAAELPPNARDDAAQYLDAALATFGQPVEAEPSQLDPASSQLALKYLKTVLDGNSQDAIELIMGAVGGGMAARDVYLDVLLPAQAEVGRMWHAGEVSVAEEHFVSETTQRAMAIIAHHADRAPANGKTVLAAAVTGNAHSIGVRTVADFFEMAGWRAVTLGPDVPAEDVAKAVEFFDVDLLALSAALPTQLKGLEEMIAAVRGGPRAVKILVGGSAFADAPGVWQRVGADGFAPTAAEAVAAGASLLGLG